MKRLVLLLTVILLALCLTSCGEKTADGFDYHVNPDGKTCTIGNYPILYKLDDWLDLPWNINANYEGSLIIPKELDGYTVTAIGDRAFEYCNSLTSITIPDSVTSIGEDAFQYCYSLTSVTIPDSVTSIGYYAFDSCSSLTSITIPDSVTSIGDHAFDSCRSLTSITIPDSVTSIGDGAFKYCNSLTSITIPDSVTSIGDYAFYWCDSLTSITIPDSVTSIGDSAFDGCRSLTSITIPDSVTSIGDYAFYDCESLTSAVIGDNVTSIGDGAFKYCDSLTSVTIPDSVTSIGDYAFSGCDNLCIIYNNSNQKINVGSAKVIVNKDGSISYADDGNKYILTDDGFLFKYKQGEYSLIYYAGKESKVTLPEKINGSTYSLESVEGLTEVIIPEGVTSIKSNAFNSGLTSITISASVTNIDPSAFDYCNKLQNIEVSKGNTVYKSIDGNLYTKDDNTLVHYARGKVETQLVIPKEAVKIGMNAFYYSSTIESVVIHNGVTNIAASAFSGCGNLEYVYFTGTQEEWKKIVIGSDNDCLINAIIVYEYIAEE